MKAVPNAADVIGGCRTTRIYCRPGCPAGKHMKPENRVRFASREEAIGQGYRACKICKPDGPNPTPEVLFSAYYDSPLGRYILVSSSKGIVCVKPKDQKEKPPACWERGNVQLREDIEYNRQVIAELDSYFNRGLQRFSVPLDMRGTPFQKRVWQALLDIPYGQTRSYGEIACAIGHPKASRAVGLANGANPISIIVPCHRVIGSNGKLVGYGGGLNRKQALLDLESRVAHRT
jgi:methylated-DNA-[protein]-cysteine S-methyltransferase